MGHNKPEVLKNISLVTYCSSQYGGFKLFVSNNEFVRCRILPPLCIYLSVYNCLFYHILGIFCSSSQLRHLRLVCCYSNSDEGLSEAAKLPLLEELSITLCSLSKESLEAVGCCCSLLKSFKWNQQWFATDGLCQTECDEEAVAIAKNVPELRHLWLIGNQLTNDGL
ncbi:F-box protein SKIP19-like [Quercus lobata]|uniref:F-box protein SKIP19-like n=1 Tax=Quercus lobata TaxID=97700 RepID=UPI0012468A76|nr:F-box protein SKIP19-like [Quercus lobata]